MHCVTFVELFGKDRQLAVSHVRGTMYITLQVFGISQVYEFYGSCSILYHNVHGVASQALSHSSACKNEELGSGLGI